jgi:hypothetical protein
MKSVRSPSATADFLETVTALRGTFLVATNRSSRSKAANIIFPGEGVDIIEALEAAPCLSRRFSAIFPQSLTPVKALFSEARFVILADLLDDSRLSACNRQFGVATDAQFIHQQGYISRLLITGCDYHLDFAEAQFVRDDNRSIAVTFHPNAFRRDLPCGPIHKLDGGWSAYSGFGNSDSVFWPLCFNPGRDVAFAGGSAAPAVVSDGVSGSTCLAAIVG